MTEQKHLKALIRARMARTGESYTAARRHIVAAAHRPTLTPTAVFRAHDRHCMTAIFTPDDAHLVSGGFGGQARIWTPDGRSVGELIGHESAVTVVRISRDGRSAVTAASDRTVRLWDLTERRQVAVLGSHKKQVLALDLDAARNRVWSGGHDGQLQAWSLADRAVDPALAFDLGGSVTSVAVRDADGAVAASTVGAGVSVRDAAGTEITRLAEDTHVTSSLAWASDGSFLLASSPSGATIWASEGWEVVRTVASGAGSVSPVALSRDGSRIALGWDHHVGLWSADDGEPPAVIEGLPKGVYGLAFSHDGASLALAAADGRVRTFAVG